MTQSRSVCSRIRNARASLDNAERSFRSNQEVRGELDLMLAEAELDNLRQKRPGISWTRHTLAACFAVLVLASGCLGWWWASAYGVVPTPPQAGNRDAGVRLSAGQMHQLIRSGRQELGNIR